jgi:hypothetical protein
LGKGLDRGQQTVYTTPMNPNNEYEADFPEYNEDIFLPEYWPDLGDATEEPFNDGEWDAHHAAWDFE